MNEINVPDQKAMWNRKHSEGEHDELRDEHTEFAEMVAGYLQPGSDILELGCGNGRDARYFAQQGHAVIATDFSEAVIERNKALDISVVYRVMDMLSDLPYKEQVDGIYAYLSIHYFTDLQTKQLIANCALSLKTGGLFAFTCKSSDSVRIQNASMIEENLYINKKSGHVLRVFTEEYIRQILQENFEILHLDDVVQRDFSRPCGVVRCIARKSA